MKKICCFFNYNPLYRFPIYNALANEYECNFYFGDTVFEPLKQFDPGKLKGFKKMLQTKRTGFKDYKWNSGIMPMFKGYSCYLITGQIDYLANWLLIVYAKLSGKPIFCWTHGAPKTEIQKPISRKIYSLFFKSMDGIFMYNHYNCSIMEELGIKKEALFVIHNSLDTSIQTNIYKTLSQSDIYEKHFGNQLPTIIYIGRIQTRKKLDLLIQAIAKINTPTRRVNAVIIGAETDDHSLRNTVTTLRQEETVWFYGPSFDEQKNAELIYNAAVCVCPAEVGLTAIHSLSYGTPVISNDDLETQMPEFEAIIEGVTGSFYQKGSIDSLASKILQWAETSPIEREQTRNKARQEITEQWSIDYQMSIFKKVFQHYMRQS